MTNTSSDDQPKKEEANETEKLEAQPARTEEAVLEANTDEPMHADVEASSVAPQESPQVAHESSDTSSTKDSLTPPPPLPLPQETHSSPSNTCSSASASPSSLVIIEESPNSNDSTSYSSCSSSAYSSLNSKSPRSVSPSLSTEKKQQTSTVSVSNNNCNNKSSSNETVANQKKIAAKSDEDEEENVGEKSNHDSNKSTNEDDEFSSASSSCSSAKRFKTEAMPTLSDEQSPTQNHEDPKSDTSLEKNINETEPSKPALSPVAVTAAAAAAVVEAESIHDASSCTPPNTSSDAAPDAALASLAQVEGVAQVQPADILKTKEKYEAMQPRLKKFLKIYQQSSRTSLSGPSKSDDLNLSEPALSLAAPPQASNGLSGGHLNDQENDNLAIIANVAAAASAAQTNTDAANVDMRLLHRISSEERLSNRNNSPSSTHIHRSSSSTTASSSTSSTPSNRLSIRDHFNQTELNMQLQQQQQHNKDNSSHNHNSYHHHNHHSHHHSTSSYHHPFKRIKHHQNNTSTPVTTKLNEQLSKTSAKSNSNTSPPSSLSSSSSSNSYMKCMQVDASTSPLLETLLHGERISCFIVGGEKRLCLHDILNTILKDFSVQQINSACQKLQIACLESSPRQLDILKKNHLLPTGAPNCGLLTQTNAERLCAFLMDQQFSTPPSSTSPISTLSTSPNLSSKKSTTLKVVHECFGKTYGHIHLSMYSKSEAACVECDTCRKLYTPKNFVCHTHKYESHTRHWGFDSANWRVYLKAVNVTSSSVLSDIKISNKDNIAANTAKSSAASQASGYNEEFEVFKQKFLNQATLSPQPPPPTTSATSATSPPTATLKRKSLLQPAQQQ